MNAGGHLQDHGPVIERLEVSAYTVPTDGPEADGTLAWDSTTLVLVLVNAAGVQGLGYSYATAAAAHVIDDVLAVTVEGRDAMAVPAIWRALVRRVRNLGREGVAAAAISAVDAALWDLKARLLGVPLVKLLGQVRDAVAVYGSGGFTSYPIARLENQLADWVQSGIPRVKMKVGAQPGADASRVNAAREAIGPAAELFVDANGAYARKQALAMADRFFNAGVTWFEEPVPSDDLEGLRLIRGRAPVGMEIAAGEYGHDAVYFRRMLAAGAVDVLQADATRCGITGFIEAAALCSAAALPLSAHTAPSLHLHVCCALAPVRHVEYFHDHVRIEQMFFDGAAQPIRGELWPDLSRPGHGLYFRQEEASRYQVYKGRH